MKKKIGCLFFCLLLSRYCTYGQGIEKVFSELQTSRPDTGRIRLLLIIGKNYEFHNYYEYNINSLKNAWLYFNRARDLSTHLKDRELLNESLVCIGDCNVVLENWKEGRKLYLQVIDYYRQTGDLNREAETWSRIAGAMDRNDPVQAKVQLEMYQNAFALYTKTNNEERFDELLQEIALWHFNNGELNLAEEELLQVLARYRAINNKKLYPVYEKLARVYKTKGNLSKQLFYLLEMIRNFEAYGEKSEQGYYSLLMGGFYADWGNYDKALTWDKKAIEANDYYGNNLYYFAYARNLVDVLLLQKKNREALSFQESAAKKHPPDNLEDQRCANESFGNCFLALGQLSKAKQYYLMALANYRALNKNRHTYSYYEDVRIHQKLGDYYFKVGDIKKSAFYLNSLKSIPTNKVKPTVLSSLYLSMFRTDSALNNYVSAIRHFQLYKKISDSLFNISKSGQIADMQTKYETASKEQSINLLKSESKAQQSELKSLNQERKITFAGVAMLLITGGIAYRTYWNKQRSNLRLQEKQKQINQQNMSLQQLVEEKDSLLYEKDWLLKEVHHRVKNNLQVVMGLLNVQSDFLENNEAISAIRESRNRVHSISLIHQKLYTTENAASVRMPPYISDLLYYLCDCYDAGRRRIRFEQLVEDISIDISQAVPLGLILNEAITNAIKYAFGPQGGEVIVAFQRVDEGTLMLSVADNGKGIPDEILNKEKQSLGMKMMRILSKQLGAIYTLRNTPGVTISLTFPEEKLAHSILNK